MKHYFKYAITKFDIGVHIMLAKFKNKIGLNLFAILGYLPIVFLLYDFFEYKFRYIGMGIWIYGFIQGFLITISLLIWIIELLCKYKIKKF